MFVFRKISLSSPTSGRGLKSISSEGAEFLDWVPFSSGTCARRRGQVRALNEIGGNNWDAGQGGLFFENSEGVLGDGFGGPTGGDTF